ncbi:hypothetical protein [Streptomyces lydicus]|uniref:hypothetical protein n=1 Tax=Streptomyces lydicus TaxID=47763 RepID=UPI001012ED0F|nr:hypothetical protein [Streptomyces lydicus]MCZ1011999.1 hypothetical protein [Streptomyces lydicus]
MPTLTAGQFLHNALSRAGIRAHADGDGASNHIAVPVGTHGIIMVTGVSGRAKENEIDYRPREHQGWGAFFYPTDEDDGTWTEVYQSTNSDLPRDTALVAAAIQDAIAGRRAS